MSQKIGGQMKNAFYHLYAPNNIISRFELLVFDQEGTVFLPLTEYYHDQKKRIGKGSAISFRWLIDKSSYQKRNVNWDDEPEAVRHAVEKYLYEVMGCKVRNRNGFNFQYITPRQLSVIVKMEPYNVVSRLAYSKNSYFF